MKVFYIPGSLSGRGLFAVVLLLYMTLVCDGQCPAIAQKPLETRLQKAATVFRAVVVQSYPEMRTLDLALVSIFKGGFELASVSQFAGSVYNTTDRQVILKVRSEFKDCFDWKMSPQRELIVFAKVSDPVQDYETTPAQLWLEATSAAVPWSLGLGFAIWSAVGWADWEEWGPCSKTCGGGMQVRKRSCTHTTCEGFGEQVRSCNTFQCHGTINPLAPDSRRNFHPTQARWDSIPGRPHAYSLKPNSYIWISSSELFIPDKSFPKEFTVFLSLRLRSESAGFGQGTLFSLRSRRKTDSYLSLELVGRGQARLVHAGEGNSKLIYLAVPLYDFQWHYIAISVHDDNTVRVFVDCKWLRTDVLEKDALVTPKDADLIIGYLFSGDLEQLSIVPRAGEASQQCSSQITEEILYQNEIST